LSWESVRVEPKSLAHVDLTNGIVQGVSELLQGA